MFQEEATTTSALKRPLYSMFETFTNFLSIIRSYPLVEMMTWQGLGDIVNKFRVNTLDLEPVSSLWAPGALYRMHVPYTYMWSPSLVPKPRDWGNEVDICGFVFLDMASNFQPPEDLQKFLDDGEQPVYIGFGSIVVDDPDKFTEMIFEATKLAGVRALVNKGWGGLGRGNDDTPKHVFMLDSTPHDWLFPKVKAVVHHGGAGTTAIGLKCAKPTMIIPFFGDQPFWAARVAEAKAGAHEVVPWKRLTAEKLAEGIKQCLTEEAQTNVQKLADGIAAEGDGADNACRSFHRSLPLAGPRNIRCSILEDRIAVWRIRGSALRLSALAAEILMEKGKLKASDLKLLHRVQWNDFDGPGEPITGTVGALSDSLYGIGHGVGMVPVRVAQHMHKRAEHERKKVARQKRKEDHQQKKADRRVKGEDNEAKQNDDAHRPSAPRVETNMTNQSQISADPRESVAQELVGDFREGFKQSGWSLLTMPNDLHVAIAQGFHNAPRLWGDATVRKPTRITGLKSGGVAARREFVYGIYDAWTGLVTQPIGGFKDGVTVPGKIVGAGTGLGKGVGGFVMKNISALISPPAYAGKGFFVYLKKRSSKGGPGSKDFMRRTHLVQGRRDLQALRDQDAPEKQGQLARVESDVLSGWKVYEDVWQTAYDQYGPVGGSVVNRFRLNREKQRWQKAGALENIHTAHRALKHAKKGDGLEAHFEKRQREMAEAEQPGESVMHTTDDFLAAPSATNTTHADEQAERKKLGSFAVDKDSMPKEDAARRSESSTVVATSEDEEKGKRRDSSPRKHPKFDHGKLLGTVASGGKRPMMGRMTTT